MNLAQSCISAQHSSAVVGTEASTPVQSGNTPNHCFLPRTSSSVAMFCAHMILQGFYYFIKAQAKALRVQVIFFRMPYAPCSLTLSKNHLYFPVMLIQKGTTYTALRYDLQAALFLFLFSLSAVLSHSIAIFYDSLRAR